MAVFDDVYRELCERSGVTHCTALGVITELHAARYARAVGETDPVYFDAAIAQERGLPAVPLLPNMIASIVLWDDGGDTAALATDGTTGEHLHGLDTTGIRVMGAGEEMTFHARAYAGVSLRLESTLTTVTSKQSSSGPMIVLEYRNVFVSDADDQPVVTCRRTVLLR